MTNGRMHRSRGLCLTLSVTIALGVGGTLANAQEHAAARPTARLREYRKAFPTYPFSDPDPIPAVGRIYPYFRFDGFSATSESREWTVVELENDYIRVLILPEIGGKIWAAIEKRSGRPFIYYNRAVKFRDIAMRGPWTSGGIEANYGILGHTPNVSTPVDYTTRRNADGSVSVTTGALDLLTMSTWRLETRLAPGEASFTTSSTWYNASALEAPYYTWMTAGIPVEGNLEYVFPGNAWIGHEGETGEWPVNRARGKEIRWYERNDFGPYKSYHVIGGTNDFFGAYWHDHDFGMARVSPRDDKPGQKIWIWGLSRQGMIWEDLLTDRDGQYSELQSGRLFNQSAEGSTFTPFKHRGFLPRQVDRWTERWMPVVGTQGFVAASDAGALNVRRDGERLILALSPAKRLDDTLRVFAGTRLVRAVRVRRAPLQPWADTITASVAPMSELRITVGGDRLAWSGDTARTALDRPLETARDFDWTSAYGLWLQGKERIRQREYDRARPLLDSALAKAPHYVPALADRAALSLRFLDDEGARQYARRALAIDAYDGAANYYYGMANCRLGRLADARDGFEIASHSPEFRGAAWVELARLWLTEGDTRRAEAYATRALAVDPGILEAHAVRLAVARQRGDRAAVRTALTALEQADPLSHLARWERLLAEGRRGAAGRWMAGIRSELPLQQVLQLAAWYESLGDRGMSRQVLEAAGDAPEALYWRAANVAADGGDPSALVARANAASPRFVFPFRPEVIRALEWALRTSDHWAPRYYLALGYWGTGRVEQAAEMLDRLGERPDFAPVYAARAALPRRDRAARQADLERAARLAPDEWRYGKRLVELHLEADDAPRAVRVAREYSARFPGHYILGLTLARAHASAREYRLADSVLAAIRVLPYEGSGEGRALYREAKLMLAVTALHALRWDDAERLIAAAREWPERLGAGKPYPENVDERLEDWLAAETAARAGRVTPASEAVRARLAGWAAQAQQGAPNANAVEGRVLRALAERERQGSRP